MYYPDTDTQYSAGVASGAGAGGAAGEGGGGGAGTEEVETVSAPPSQYAPGSAAEMAAGIAADLAAATGGGEGTGEAYGEVGGAAGAADAGYAHTGYGAAAAVGQGAYGAWQPVTDPSTNATYYHNPTTGQTSWALPS